MTTEFRRLTFSFDELPEILETCGNKRIDKVPGGSVGEVEAKTVDGEFYYSIKFFDASNDKENSIDIREKDAHQALIDYCKKRKIPIPKDSLKTVRVVNSYLCMDILLGKAETLGGAEEFLASISHQLRTPLNTIIGLSEMIKASVFGPLDNSHYRNYVEDIHVSGKDILGLIVNECDDVKRGHRKAIFEPLR